MGRKKRDEGVETEGKQNVFLTSACQALKNDWHYRKRKKKREREREKERERERERERESKREGDRERVVIDSTDKRTNQLRGSNRTKEAKEERTTSRIQLFVAMTRVR